MYDSKLIDLLRLFKARDYRRFGEFLASPYFNKRQDLIDFFQELRKLAPDYAEEACQREEVWKRYAPGKPFDGKTLNYLANFLLELVEKYLLAEYLQEDPVNQGNQLMDFYLHNRLPKHYRSTLLKTRKALKAEKFRDSEWHLKAWRTEELEMQQFYASRIRISDDTIRKVTSHLDAFYLDRIFELGTELYSLSQMFGEEFDTGYVEGLYPITGPQARLTPTIRIPRWIFHLHLHPEDEATFKQLLNLLPKLGDYYPPERVKGIFAYVQNHCIRRIRLGDTQYEQLLFEIYQQSIESKVIYENGKLNPWDFKNICSIALKLGEFKWTRQFIREESGKIAADFRDSAVAYNMGNLHFHEGKYDLALRALAQVEFSDIYYALDTRRIMLMIYFERQDEEGLESLISSFRGFLKRTQGISDRNRQGYRNFVDWVSRLSRNLLIAEEKEKAGYVSRIRETDPLIGREWLLKQIDRE